MARLSGLQREVLSLYRKCLREIRKKPVVSPRSYQEMPDQSINSLLTNYSSEHRNIEETSWLLLGTFEKTAIPFPVANRSSPHPNLAHHPMVLTDRNFKRMSPSERRISPQSSISCAKGIDSLRCIPLLESAIFDDGGK